MLGHRLSVAIIRTGFATLSYLAVSTTEAGAVPPPPVPKAWTEASSNVSSIASTLTGDWRAADPATGDTVELRIGSFGDSANPYLLIGRVVHIPQGQSGSLGEVQVYNLSVLTYLSPCHVFAMLALDHLAHEGDTIDCAGSFPIELGSDGALTFSYMDENESQRVDVSVSGSTWRETTMYPAQFHLKPRQVEFHRTSRAVIWGGVR